MTDNYDDIIDLPHYTSIKRPRMVRARRAAQFAPFAALGEDSLHCEKENLADLTKKNKTTQTSLSQFGR